MFANSPSYRDDSGLGMGEFIDGQAAGKRIRVVNAVYGRTCRHRNVWGRQEQQFEGRDDGPCSHYLLWISGKSSHTADHCQIATRDIAMCKDTGF
jgi:hypothetical protein